jgi:hypothetical protein
VTQTSIDDGICRIPKPYYFVREEPRKPEQTVELLHEVEGENVAE